MTHPTRQLHLGAFLMSVGHHAAGWRFPGVDPANTTNFKYYKKLAQTAEAGKFDMIFFADRLAISDRYNNNFDTTVSYLAQARLEPISLLGALSAVTERLGLAATASTTYNEPYFLARAFATLDHLSSGRIAWNIVTSTNNGEALNFSLPEHPEHEVRYDRARAFVDVVTSLWDSWEDDAMVHDKQQGVYADAGKVHYVNHRSEWFGVRGPLNVARPPQGHPVLIQAGSSETGRDFAARHAEVIFSSQPVLEDAQRFYADIRQRILKYGRSADSIKVMPGVMPIIGATEAEAREKFRMLEDLVHPLGGLSLLSDSMNHDLSVYPLDEPLPELESVNGNQSRFKLVQAMARKENLTLRQLGKRFGGSRSHRVVCGTAEQVADDFTRWFESRACDGFNLMPAYLPEGLEDFVGQVVPILQERGLFRREYEGATLREHLGLERPGNRYRP
jgi:FMN-dependent oxidoreductase (nitrilotriacetate monooxygenase family)